MRTIKQVAELTGVSVRTLQYYDEIGLFAPSQVSEAGYRLYDDESLEILQQILFFKELDFPLKGIKEIMENPKYDKIKAFKQQKELLTVKRDRINGLLRLLDKLEKGEDCMSFKEFDMSDYFNALQEFKAKHEDEVIKYWGSIEAFERLTEQFESKEEEIAKMAILQYGSIEKYTAAMKKNLENFSETMEKMSAIKGSQEDYIARSKEIHMLLTSDLTRDIASEEVQNTVKELVDLSNRINNGLDMGDNYWNMVVDGYLTNVQMIEINDRIYGKGASEFIGKAIEYFLKQNERNDLSANMGENMS